MTLATASRDIPSDLVDYVRRQGYVRGDRLPSIRQLADALGVGRNAVRDGVLQAQAMGLVRIEPRLGIFVQDPEARPAAESPARMLEQALAGETHNVFHLIDARLLVELELVGKAAQAGHSEELLPLRQALEAVLADHDDRAGFIQADEAFHLEIARLAGNRVLFHFLQVLWRLIGPAKSTFLLSDENRELSDREHRNLFQSIVDGDPQRARSIMSAHIGQGRDLLLDYVRTMPATGSAKEVGA